MRDADPALATQLDRGPRGRPRPRQHKTQDAELADGAQRAAAGQGRVRDRADAPGLRRDRRGLRRRGRRLPEAVRRGRGERWVEGVFGLHARHVGNGVGYDTIAASGDHACTLHWIRNDGELREGDLLLVDAGVELDTLYTADVTRTLPVDGRFSDDQREVYEAVLEAQQAGIDAAQAGREVPRRARGGDRGDRPARSQEWGLLPVTAEESLAADGGQHRRWMVHGTSHHLGIDVHDCAQARRENYRDGTLGRGMVITVEPGLYFKSDDELVPEELRGIGVRIEDDILITADGGENLSAGLPRSSADVEAWMATLLPDG